ncbi:MAG: CoA transferase [Gammaproteobacteria bacterium]|nr:CoA transferase [Gammaproteobacteria bacterium]
MTGPLNGIRVLDLTSMISGPIATMMLGDQGADVIKVEPLTGDLVRGLRADGAGGLSAMFISSNRSKRSLALNLKDPEGLELLKRLIPTTDVLVQNFRPGAIERMGLGEDTVRALRRDIVYVSISGYGETGPYAHKRVYDPMIQALSGLTSIQADAATGRPKMVRVIVPDKLTAVTAAQAITAALFARERTGKGQHIKLAMLDTMVAFLWPEAMTGYTFVGREVHTSRSQLTQDLIYETVDGYITVGAVSDTEWKALCRALDKSEWLEDERFKTLGDRSRNIKDRLDLTADTLKGNTSEYWLARLDAESVPCAPVLSRAEAIEHEQIRANELIRELEHPVVGTIRQPRPAARFDETPSDIQRHAPSLGEHTEEILRQELNLDSDEIEKLRSGGTILVWERL